MKQHDNPKFSVFLKQYKIEKRTINGKDSKFNPYINKNKEFKEALKKKVLRYSTTKDIIGYLIAKDSINEGVNKFLNIHYGNDYYNIIIEKNNKKDDKDKSK